MVTVATWLRWATSMAVVAAMAASVPAGAAEDVALAAAPGGVPGDPIAIAPDLVGRDASILSNGDVAYSAAESAGGVLNLYQSSLLGGDRTVLWAGDAGHEGVAGFRISPDEQHVVFLADSDVPGKLELYSVAAEGSTAAVKLNVSLYDDTGDIDLDGVVIGPGSESVFYAAAVDAADRSELFRVPIGGGASVRLNGSLTAAGQTVDSYDLASDGTRVVYIANQDDPSLDELFVVDAAGGATTKLNPAGPGIEVERARVSPDSQSVAFTATVNDPTTDELFVIPITGGAAEQLNPTPTAGGEVLAFEWSTDASHVVFTGDLDTDDTVELYSTPVDTPSPIKLNGALAVGGNVQYFEIAPTYDFVVYEADQDRDDDVDLFSVPLVGGEAVKLNPNASTEAELVFLHPLGFAVFVARAGPDKVARLYSSGLDSAGDWEWLSKRRSDLDEIYHERGTSAIASADTPCDGSIYDSCDGGRGEVYRRSPSRRVVFAGSAPDSANIELFSIRPGGRAFRTLVSPNGGVPLDVSGTHVVFLADGVLSSVAARHFQCGGWVTHLGTPGDDVIVGTPGIDLIKAWTGDDVIDGRGGNDFICAGGGNDVVRGRDGDDWLFGNGGRDQLRGGPGNDSMDAGFGADVLWGGPGNDYLYDRGGPDEMHGGDGNDTLRGEFGDDVLFGGPGDDELFGAGFLSGPDGFDICNGGAGLDTAEDCEEEINIP